MDAYGASSNSVLGLSVIQEITEKSETPRFTTMSDLDAEVIALIKKSFHELNILWDQIGIVGEMREDRSRTLIVCHADLQKQMIEEECQLLQKLKSNISNLLSELETLCMHLNLAEEDFRCSGNTLLEQEAWLKEKCSELGHLKKQRVNEFDVLFDKEQELCTYLDMPQTYHKDTVGIPSEECLSDMEQHIRLLQDEKKIRESKYTVLQSEILDLAVKMEFVPRNDFEVNLVSEANPFLLSKETIRKASDWLKELQDIRIVNQNRIKYLQSRLNILWDCFSVNSIEREVFLTSFPDYSLKTIKAFEVEVEKFEKEKRDNMGSFIQKLRSELILVWEKCYVSEEERTHFYAFQDEKYTEELLELHETELQKWRSYYEDNQNIFERITKREELFEQMIAFETKANDPTRYNNRGGNLLQEEKERKRLLKQLPQLENVLIQLIENHENKCGTPFLVKGFPFKDYIDSQWETHKQDKENAKAQRQLKKQEECTNLTTFGMTPSKRPLQSANPTPAKMLRLNTPKGISNLVTSSRKSPMKRVANSTQRASPRTRLGTAAASSVMKEIARTPRRSPRHIPQAQRILTNQLNEIKAPALNNASLNYSKFKCDLNKQIRSNARSTLENPLIEVLDSTGMTSTSSRVSSTKAKVLASKLSPHFNNDGSMRSRKSLGLKPSNQYRLNRSSVLNKSKNCNKSALCKSKLSQPRGIMGLPFLI